MPANNGARRRQERRASAQERLDNPPRSIEERLAVAGARERAKLEGTES
jgi:hypothetical protein